jgi:hypothetical protein
MQFDSVGAEILTMVADPKKDADHDGKAGIMD